MLHGLIAGVGVSAASPAARAATELAGATLEVENSGDAATCPDSDALRIRTLALGLPPTEPREALDIRVRFRRENGFFHATVTTAGRSSGERELTDASTTCDALAAATAVTLAVLLDLRPYEGARPSSKSAPAASASERGEPGLFRHAALHAHEDVAYGVLGPAFSVAFGGDARLRLSRIDVTLGGFASLERSVDLLPGTVEVGLAAGYLGFCVAALRASRLELGGCASFELGRFRGAGHGYYGNEERSALWLAGSIGATLAFELSRHWAVRLGAGMVIPFQQQEPVVNRVGRAYDAPAVGGVATLGPELRFP